MTPTATGGPCAFCDASWLRSVDHEGNQQVGHEPDCPTHGGGKGGGMSKSEKLCSVCGQPLRFWLTIKELAAALGVSRSHALRILRGSRADIMWWQTCKGGAIRIRHDGIDHLVRCRRGDYVEWPP